ncbi:plasma-membrane choline transporter-domain-containing protein [Catenaria anguillulae PL171]|uniref:Protein PNS1 n=1 Tax=Catenaria anguillulae PL171 TaxID=765915 RepID=A0A1Y2HW38_9FUNG|nr:plasma-membrane choline transporter-domain-containing protein [Catenaria anguillulae PL171]
MSYPPQQVPAQGQAYPPQQQQAYPSYPPQSQPQAYPSYPPQQGSPYPPQQQQPAAYPPAGPAYPMQDGNGAAYPPQNNHQYDPYANKSNAYGAVPPPAPPGYATDMAGSGANLVAQPDPETRFAPPKGPQDLWAAILFLVQFAGFCAIAALSIPKVDFSTMKPKDSPSSSPSTGSGSGPDIGSNAIVAMGGSAFFALILSIAYLMAMRKYPKPLIKFTFWFSIAFFIAFGLFSIVVGRNIVGGVVCLIVAVLYIVFYRAYKSRFPFAAVMLETVASVTMKYPGTVGIGIAGLVVQLAYIAFFAVTAIASFIHFGQTTTTVRNGRTVTSVSGISYVLWLYLVFSFYWTCQVIGNVVHVTVSGVFAAFYFLSGSQQGMPGSPTMSAFGRAMTTSFGSICYGSLLIALIQTLRSVLFNKYAYTQVAIYGKDFCRAAKDTWTLVKDRGIDALINDDLIGNVIGFGSLLVGGMTVLAAWLIYSVGKAVGSSTTAGFDAALLIVLLVAFFAGVVMFSLIGGVVTSGTATTFVCLAEDPAALRATKPELWEKIRQTYPEAAFVSMFA